MKNAFKMLTLVQSTQAFLNFIWDKFIGIVVGRLIINTDKAIGNYEMTDKKIGNKMSKNEPLCAHFN